MSYLKQRYAEKIGNARISWLLPRIVWGAGLRSSLSPILGFIYFEKRRPDYFLGLYKKQRQGLLKAKGKPVVRDWTFFLANEDRRRMKLVEVLVDSDRWVQLDYIHFRAGVRWGRV